MPAALACRRTAADAKTKEKTHRTRGEEKGEARGGEQVKRSGGDGCGSERTERQRNFGLRGRVASCHVHVRHRDFNTMKKWT